VELPESFEPIPQEEDLLKMYETVRAYEKEASRIKKIKLVPNWQLPMPSASNLSKLRNKRKLYLKRRRKLERRTSSNTRQVRK